MKRRTIKSALAFLLSAVMMFSMSVSVFAVEEPSVGTQTEISDTEDDNCAEKMQGENSPSGSGGQ